jgi:hypothetical protein
MDDDVDDDVVRLEKGMDAAGVDRSRNKDRFMIIIWFLFHNTLAAFGAIMMMHNSYVE